MALEVVNVLNAAGRKIVNYLHGPTPFQKGFGQVRSDEPSSARDQRSRHVDPRDDARFSKMVGRAARPAANKIETG